MEPRRTTDQVVAAAAAMDRARAAGLPDDILVILLQARRAWWSGTMWPGDADLRRAASHPAASMVDELVVQVIRRRLQARGS